MEKVKSNQEKFIEGIHMVTGISLNTLIEYGKKNDLLHIIDHPKVIGATESQIEKLKLLKHFINSYRYLRQNEEENSNVLNTPAKLAGYFKSQLAFEREREYFIIAYFDAKMHLLSCEKTEGTISECYVYPRDFVIRALQLDCSGIVVAHNHPSGDTTPSMEDLAITKRITAIFQSMGISVYDHIIIGNDNYCSLKEKGYMDESARLPRISDYTPVNLTHASEQEEEDAPEL